jgi:hypothetical protein
LSSQSDGTLDSSSESEFEADPEELVESESSNDASDFAASDVSDEESGSDFGGDGESDEGRTLHRSAFLSHISITGDDWDELERKAAKSDMKRADGTKKRDSDDSDDDRPKKKKPSGKPNGKRR